jgi:3-oxoacyl-[acyl-carrier protein] reductase
MTFRFNVFGAIAALQPNINCLKKAESSGVVFFSSVAVNTGLGFHASIATSKSALQGLSVALASEYAAARICFNVLAPSLTDTNLGTNLISSEEKREASARPHPLGKLRSAEDMASAATFLLSEEAGWIT